MKPLVSVVIPNYNRQQLIQRAIDSVLNQTYPNLEIIIVDDNSTDESKEVINQYLKKHKNIQAIFSPINKGANYCRNIGIQNTKGSYVAFLDSDDSFVDSKIEKQMNFLKTENADIVFCDFVNHGNINKLKNKSGIITLKDVIFDNQLGGFSTFLIKKDVLTEVNCLDESLPSCQDWDLIIKVLKEHKGFFVGEKLVDYYVQEDSITKKPDKVIEGHEIVFKKVNKLNRELKIVDSKQLESKQNFVLASILLKHGIVREARYYFKKSIILKPNFLSGIYFLASFINISVLKKFKGIRNTLVNNITKLRSTEWR